MMFMQQTGGGGGGGGWRGFLRSKKAAPINVDPDIQCCHEKGMYS